MKFTHKLRNIKRKVLSNICRKWPSYNLRHTNGTFLNPSLLNHTCLLADIIENEQLYYKVLYLILSQQHLLVNVNDSNYENYWILWTDQTTAAGSSAMSAVYCHIPQNSNLHYTIYSTHLPKCLAANVARHCTNLTLYVYILQTGICSIKAVNKILT